MQRIFSENAWEDYLYWQQTDKQILRRINLLIKEILFSSPFKSIFEEPHHNCGSP